MKRRILPMIMAVIMILSIIQVPAWAATGDDPAGEDGNPGQVSEQPVEESAEPSAPVEEEEPASNETNSLPNGETEEEPAPEEQADNVAEVNGQGFPTLQAAINAAKDNVETTVKLIDNIVMSTSDIATIPEGKLIVLDMDGKSITVDSGFEGRPIVNDGVLTVTGNGIIDASDSESGLGAINNKGTLTVENGTYRGATYANGAAIRNTGTTAVLVIKDGTFEEATCAVFNEGTTTIEGGTFAGTTCSQCNSDIWGYTIRNYNANAKMTINGGTFTGVQGAVSASIGYLEINDGTFRSVKCTKNTSHTATFYALYAAGEVGKVKTVINGGTFETEGKVTAVLIGNDNTGGDGGINAEATAIINGGTFKAPEGVPALKGAEKTGDPIIYGGTFSSDVSEYLADTVKGTSEGGNFIVKPLEEGDQETVAEVGGEYYKSLSAAIAAAKDGGTVTLLKDTELTSVRISKGITLDLGGKTLKLVAGSTSPVGLFFSSGSSKIINGTIQDERVVVSEGNNTAGYYMVVVNGDGTSLETSNVTMITNRPDISTNQYTYIIQLQNGSSATLNSGTVLKDQMYNGQTYETYGAVGVTVLGTNGGTTTSLTVNEGAEISTYGFAVSGNGTMHGTSITINGGEIISEISTAIYHPQDGEITINDGSAITGENAGIEIRSGELTVNGGTIQATAEKFECDPNESGTTTVGAALAIAQHTTKKDITVTINGGTFIGVKALNESNPQVNDPAPQVELSVRDGDFQGEVTTADVNNFVSGGTFSSVVKAEYCATGFVPVTTADSNGKYTVTVAENMTAKIVGANGNDVAAYENLSNAVKAVKSGQTIVLLEDVTDALPVPQVADVTYTAVDGVTVSGGMSGTVAGDLTLNGITFTQKDVYLNGKEDATVTVKDCTFSGVAAHGNKLGAFNMVTAGNLVFTGNTITGTKDAGGSTEAVGIYTQNLTDVTISDNTIGAVSGTSINVNGNKGTTTITGNELTDWASAGGNTPGRAIRLSDSGDGNVTITGNKLVNNKETLESYIKISGVEENSVDATKNYWNGKSPDAKAGDGNPLFEVADATVDGSKITSEPYFEAATMRDPEDLSNYVPPVDPDDDHGSSSSGSSSSVRRYDIEADAGRGGDISPDGRVRVRRGENQTFRITADDGYEIYDVEVDGESVGAVSRYTFENVREDHTISATFRQTGAQTEEAQLPFLDVAEGAWYYDAVAYCYENGIMDGTSSVSFAPGMLLNRAMAAQVLYNLADGTASTAAGFPDVVASAWYADAVNWAAANGYVTGYDNGSFGPEDSLTREQLAVILYRYAGSPEPTGSLDGFTDAASTSDYAVDALRWAVGEGLLTGKDGGRLDPAGTASRAELAQILARFAQM